MLYMADKHVFRLVGFLLSPAAFKEPLCSLQLPSAVHSFHDDGDLKGATGVSVSIMGSLPLQQSGDLSLCSLPLTQWQMGSMPGVSGALQ